MQDLQLVGIHQDDEHVLLSGPDGQHYRLPIDDALRAAVRRDRVRLGQAKAAPGTSAPVRPKDIQTQIRAGYTAEEIAQSSGISVEHVRRYEGPVLAERAHMCQVAQRHMLRGYGSDRTTTLGDQVQDRLTAREVGDVNWDAWRMEDASWTVQVAFKVGTKVRRAKWLFWPNRSHLEPLDDEARWLMARDGDAHSLPSGRDVVYEVGHGASVSPVPERTSAAASDSAANRAGATAPATTAALPVAKAAPAAPAVRPSASPAATATTPARTAARAAAPQLAPTATQQPTAPATPPTAHRVPDAPAAEPSFATTDELLSHLQSRRGVRGPEPRIDDPDAGNELGAGHLAAATPIAPQLPPPAHPAPQDISVPATSAPEAAGPAVASNQPVPEVATVDVRDAKKPSSKSRRPKVPSWDEIMFGSKRD